jgi:N-acetylglucosamine-6-phosphate deacetylase
MSPDSSSSAGSGGDGPRAAPRGLFDLQVNGFAGIDFQQAEVTAEEMSRAVQALQVHGTDRILLTLITDKIDALCAKLERFERHRRNSPAVAATVVGYHIEGPYLSAVEGYRGAHDPNCMKDPSIAEFERLWDASGGNVRLITLAPEREGAAEFIGHATKRGVRIAIGHSDASESAIDTAITAGATMCTHLGNGVPTILHRHDNVIYRLLARDELWAVFIPDGIHVPPATLRLFVRLKPAERVLFTSDCMSAAGGPPGRYRIGRFEVDVGVDGVVREPGRATFAGSSVTMDRAVQNVQQFLGWTEARARAACGDDVARYFGLPPAVG